jgi:uncharacterized protein (DUF2236 family)
VPERTHAERMAARDGYFAPESLIRRLGNSPVVPFLGGGPAVLLQVAHPLVAAGVTQHSDYQDDLWRRLLRTLRALYLMAYGTKQEAEWAGEAVQRVHDRVHGTLAEAAGPFPAGTPYRADDPALMLWVHATLVHSSLAVFTRFVSRLDPLDEERYYQEMAVVARLFGVPAGTLPATLAGFREYVVAMLDGPDLVVTPRGADVARVILDAPLPAPMRVLVPAHRLSTAWLLGPRLRDGYGLRWSPGHDAALAVAARSVRLTAWPVLKAAARFAPTGPALARA